MGCCLHVGVAFVDVVHDLLRTIFPAPGTTIASHKPTRHKSRNQNPARMFQMNDLVKKDKAEMTAKRASGKMRENEKVTRSQ